MNNTQNFRSYIKNGASIIYIATSVMGYLGLVLDGFQLDYSVKVIINNSATFLIILISNLLLSLRIIKLPLSFGIIVYSLILNITCDFFITPYNEHEALFFFRNSFFIIYLMVLTYLIVNRVNGIIITFIYFASYMYLTFSSKNPFLMEFAFLLMTIFLSFSSVTYFFVRAFEKSINMQLEKNRIIEQQSKLANDTNTLLEERQKRIATQKEELEHQKHILAKKNEELNDLVATKDKFFSIIAHDLKNPLNTLIGFSELLYKDSKSFDKVKQEKMIETIYKNSKNTYNLLENLLLWSRMQTGRIKENPQNINIIEIIEESDILLRNLRKQKQIILTSNFVPESIVFGDPFMVTSVVHNLLTNAIKFTPPEGRIHISSQKKDKMLIICVADNGIGIPKEEIAKLFRIDHSYSREGTDNEKGTGLGLLLCKEFIERNHGKIWVESDSGMGSKFFFTLKLAESYE